MLADPEPTCTEAVIVGVNRWNAGMEAERRDAERDLGPEGLTMWPLGRTALIPLQLEINESLILHPLLLPLFPLPLLRPAIMSFSVDDLVASLSGNHIGQEAIDLAALQVPFISRPSSQLCGGTNLRFTP